MIYPLRQAAHAAIVGLAVFALSGPVSAQQARPSTAKQGTSAPAKSAPANEYSTESAAKSRCPTDTVVWVNKSSKIFHFANTPDYGRTKRGAYMCEKQAMAANFHAAKNEKHP